MPVIGVHAFLRRKGADAGVHTPSTVGAAAVRQGADRLYHGQAVREHRELQRTEAAARQQKSGAVHAVLRPQTPVCCGLSSAQPALSQVWPGRRTIIADGRSGTNRNALPCWSTTSDYSRWEIGDKPQQGKLTDRIDEHYSRWEIGDKPQLKLVSRIPHDHYSRWEIGDKPQPDCHWVYCLEDYSRWEIGDKPQHERSTTASRNNYSRWEIGDKPQPFGAYADGYDDYSRWEIGDKPQPYPDRDLHSIIIADGRSGTNRNMGLAGSLGGLIIADGRSGTNRNTGPLGLCQVHYSRWEIGDKPQHWTIGAVSGSL